ncbi:hypothetical protein Pst134EA_019024 [Puccinia striiformis f. sp. tritici]|uniref:hypothetical protein n=1 Tax=Puccinia striiformis f. sp. tritici TaxID=168172 RepID=UPI0020083B37|nr:hypothetical protein Pst134EA_019024 [Puccinia striiformis f. sp. tritici]KAH9458870.1 hypothetical protein Pst134EA_019024 [Puccinia striiformis f. sp. tritici]
MLSELQFRAADLGSAGSPRFSSGPKQEPSPVRVLEWRLLGSHHISLNHIPLNPIPVRLEYDPLSDILSKKQQPTIPGPPPLDLSRGPRKITKRFVRRRYQAVLSQVPILAHETRKTNQPNKNDKKTSLMRDPSDGQLVDRNWITPSSSSDGDHRSSYSVKMAGDPLGSIKFLDMSDEDLDWMP